MTAAACVVAAVFVALAVLHGFWALGGAWPGRDRDDLWRRVVGGPAGMRGPSAAAAWLVAALLFGASVAVLAVAGVLPVATPAALRWAVVGGAGLLLVRGVEGFFDHRLRPETRGSPFISLNRRLYSPLCLALSALTFAATR